MNGSEPSGNGKPAHFMIIPKDLPERQAVFQTLVYGQLPTHLAGACDAALCRIFEREHHESEPLIVLFKSVCTGPTAACQRCGGCGVSGRVLGQRFRTLGFLAVGS